MNTEYTRYKDVPTQLMDYLLGPIRWQLVDIGFELKLYDLLSSAKSSNEVAKTLALLPKQTVLLLKSLCSLGLVEENDNNTYQLTERAKPYLLSNSSYSMRDLLSHLGKVKHTDNDTIKTILKTGNSDLLASQFRNENFWQRSQDCLYSFHNSISNDIVMEILQDLPQWKKSPSLLDLGAGSESLCKAIVKDNPNAVTTLFDLPACVAHIKKRLDENIPITMIAGDFNVDDIGKGYDIIWAAMSLYYAKDLASVLTTIKKALNTNGVFLSFHEALKNNRTQPEAHVTGRFLPAISGSDLSFDSGVIASQLKKVGFRHIETSFIDMPNGEMRLDIAYV